MTKGGPNRGKRRISTKARRATLKRRSRDKAEPFEEDDQTRKAKQAREDRHGSGSRGGRRQNSRARGRGRGQGNRGRGEDRTENQRRNPVTSLDRKIHHAERAYNNNTNPDIRKIIQNLEEEAIQAQSESEMEDWEFLIPDPGNTRGRMTLFKQSIHVYWVMRRLLAKAME